MDEGGNHAVRVDLQILGRELLGVGADVDLVHLVRQAALLEHD